MRQHRYSSRLMYSRGNGGGLVNRQNVRTVLTAESNYMIYSEAVTGVGRAYVVFCAGNYLHPVKLSGGIPEPVIGKGYGVVSCLTVFGNDGGGLAATVRACGVQMKSELVADVSHHISKHCFFLFLLRFCALSAPDYYSIKNVPAQLFADLI